MFNYGPTVMETKRSVAVAIRNQHKVLIVQRPSDDEDLPYEWGLPAATLRADETWQAAVKRAGREKLDVELNVGAELNRGTLERQAYILEMRLFDAEIVAGAPKVPQSDDSVTQYQAWNWGTVEDLRPAADKGSLCCRLFVDAMTTE